MKTAEDFIRDAERARQKGAFQKAYDFLFQAADLLRNSRQCAEAERLYRLSAHDMHRANMAFEPSSDEEPARLYCEAFVLGTRVASMYAQAGDLENALDRYVEALHMCLQAGSQADSKHFYLYLGRQERDATPSGFWKIMKEMLYLLATRPPGLSEENRTAYQELANLMMRRADELRWDHDKAAVSSRPARLAYDVTWAKCSRCGKPIPRGLAICAICKSVLAGAGSVYHHHHPRI